MEELTIMKWEYKVIGSLNSEKLSDLGQKGWEAVGIVSDNGSVGCLLKRPAGKLRIVEHHAATVE